jgi:ABC-type dipeptide/oligopeptide/nickel transport system permease component
VVEVSVGAEVMERRPVARVVDRLAAMFLLVVLGAGSLVLWIGIPFGLLWFFSRVTESWNGHFLMSLVLIPIAMALFAPALFWLNGLYLRVTGVVNPDEEDEDADRRLRGPLELFLYLGMIAALIALTVWFFFYANNPPEVVW